MPCIPNKVRGTVLHALMIYQLHTCKESIFRYFLQPPPWQKYSCHHCSTPITYRYRDGRRATDHDALLSELPLKKQYLCRHCSTTTMYRYRDGRGATDHDALRGEWRSPASRAVRMSTAPKVISDLTCIFTLF
jgi:hypothetical protein